MSRKHNLQDASAALLRNQLEDFQQLVAHLKAGRKTAETTNATHTTKKRKRKANKQKANRKQKRDVDAIRQELTAEKQIYKQNLEVLRQEMQAQQALQNQRTKKRTPKRNKKPARTAAAAAAENGSDDDDDPIFRELVRRADLLDEHVVSVRDRDGNDDTEEDNSEDNSPDEE